MSVKTNLHDTMYSIWWPNKAQVGLPRFLCLREVRGDSRCAASFHILPN